MINGVLPYYLEDRTGHHTGTAFDEIYDRLGLLPFTAEFKYDGQRAQIHASRNENNKAFVKIFSRHLEDMTEKVGARRRDLIFFSTAGK